MLFIGTPSVTLALSAFTATPERDGELMFGTTACIPVFTYSHNPVRQVSSCWSLRCITMSTDPSLILYSGHRSLARKD